METGDAGKTDETEVESSDRLPLGADTLRALRGPCLAMACLSLVDLGFTGVFVAIAGRPDAIWQAVPINLALLVGLNVAGVTALAWPIARALARGTPTRRAVRRLRTLPALCAAWAFGLGIVHATALFLVGVFLEDPAALADLPLSIRIAAFVWYAFAYAATFAVVAYFLAAEQAARLRARAQAQLGTVLPARRGRLLVKLCTAFAYVTLMPVAIVLADLVAFTKVRAAQGFTPLEAVVFDLTTAGLAALFVVVSTARGLLRPLGALTTAVSAVRGGELDHPAPVLSDDEIGRLTADFNAMLAGLRERERLRAIFGRYVSPRVAEAIMRRDPDGSQGGRLGGELRMATIMFTDVKGFTGLSERFAPQQMIDMLNAYFELAHAAIEAEGGTILNFMGDAVHALFNVPHEVPDHAAAAVRAALAIQAALAERTFPGGVQLETRIGINTGAVVAGSVGSPERLTYTVYGDAVNLAARLEPLNKTYGTSVLVSEATASAAWDLHGRTASFTRLGETEIRGRSSPVHVFGIEPVAGRGAR